MMHSTGSSFDVCCKSPAMVVGKLSVSLLTTELQYHRVTLYNCRPNDGKSQLEGTTAKEVVIHFNSMTKQRLLLVRTIPALE
jgi:hypothetical protein